MESQATRLPDGPPRKKNLVDRARYAANFLLDPIGFVEGRFERYGDVYFVPDDPPGLFVLKHPDHLRELLSTQASKFKKQHSAFVRLERVLGEGLLTTDGEVWKRQRRLVQPGFSRTRLASYADAMVDETRRSVRGLSGVQDISREMMELTLRTVCRTLFGHDASGDVGTVARSMEQLQKSLAISEFLPSWTPFRGERSVEKSIADLDRVVMGVIRARRQEIDRAGLVAAASSPTEAAPTSDLLDALLRAVDAEGDGSSLSEREVRDQLMTLFLAGHETTSHCLSWTLYLLSQNPGVRERLIEQIRSVLGDRPATIEDLPRLPLAEQVIQESLRLYPPAYVLARRASEDCSIGGFEIPRGAEVIAWIYMTQRDPRWFEDPLAFKPERFEKEAEKGRHPFAFIPFGAGPRSCIGKSFAMLEAVLMLTTLCQSLRFDLAPGQDVTPSARITLQPRKGLRMKVSPV